MITEKYTKNFIQRNKGEAFFFSTHTIFSLKIPRDEKHFYFFMQVRKNCKIKKKFSSWYEFSFDGHATTDTFIC